MEHLEMFNKKTMNIEETTKEPFIPDYSLRDVPPMDLSSIRATADSAMAQREQFLSKESQLYKDNPLWLKPGETQEQYSLRTGGTTGTEMGGTTGTDLKTSIGNFLQGGQQQDYQQDFLQKQQAFMSVMGITPEVYTQVQDLSIQLGSLNKQLQQLDIAEQQAMLDIERLMPGALLSRVRGEQAQVERTMYFKKAGIAAQMTGIEMTRQALQGNIDKADNLFLKALDYATAKERDEANKYMWAMDFYQDIEESEKRWLQQEYENSFKEYQQKYNEEQDKLQYQLDVAKYQLDVAKLGTISGLGSIGSGIVPPEQEKIILKNYVDQLPIGQRDAAYGAIATFKNGQDIISLLESVSTGPLVGRGQSIQQMFGGSSEEFNRLKAAMTSFAANYIKGISGVAVSEQEYKRLMEALPNVNKQENVNIDVIKELLNTIKNKYSTQLGIEFDAFPNEIPSPTSDIQFEREYNQLYGTSKKGGFLQTLGSFFFGGSK